MTPARPPRLHSTVRLRASGLAKVLGDLEARVVRAVWQLERPVPARAVHKRVARAHEVKLLTVVTVLNKLVRKGVLARTKREDLFHYSARFTEEEFLALASRKIVEGVLQLSPRLVAASLVDVLAERDPEELEELSCLVRRKLRERGG